VKRNSSPRGENERPAPDSKEGALVARSVGKKMKKEKNCGRRTPKETSYAQFVAGQP